MFGTPSPTPAFGTPSSTSAFGSFGTPSSSTPAFGSFGKPSSTPAFGSFGTPSSTPAFGSFGTPSTPAFGTPSSTPAFGTPSSTPAFGAPSASPAFGTPSSTPGFGTQSLFGASSLFPHLQQQQQQQQRALSLFPQQQQQAPSPFGIQPTPSPFGNAQITTQMAPVTPLPMQLSDRDIMTIVDAYKEEPGSPKYSFRHLLFSVTDPASRVKPVGVSDIMWTEAMGKLEGMRSSDRERLWPQLVQGFKDLSDRVKLQDEAIVSDAERIRTTQSNVKMLIRHFQADTIQWGERLKQKEQHLQRRLIRVMRIVETLEGKGFRMPLTKDELSLAEKLAAMLKQLKGPGGELSRKVHNLLAISRVHASAGGVGGSLYLPASAKIEEQSLVNMQEVLQQQTEAIARLSTVLKRDTRDMEIIMSENTAMEEDGRTRGTLKNQQKIAPDFNIK